MTLRNDPARNQAASPESGPGRDGSYERCSDLSIAHPAPPINSRRLLFHDVKTPLRGDSCAICGGATVPAGRGWLRCDACECFYKVPASEKAVKP